MNEVDLSYEKLLEKVEALEVLNKELLEEKELEARLAMLGRETLATGI